MRSLVIWSDVFTLTVRLRKLLPTQAGWCLWASWMGQSDWWCHAEMVRTRTVNSAVVCYFSNKQLFFRTEIRILTNRSFCIFTALLIYKEKKMPMSWHSLKHFFNSFFLFPMYCLFFVYINSFTFTQILL